jgi:hypothetical protein
MSVSNDIESTLKTLHELMKKREEELDKREKELEKAEARLKEKYPSYEKESDVMHLNVGGTPICVLRRTLNQVEGSLLAYMFSGHWDENLEKDSEGRFFLDQDQEVFKPLISFLREMASQTNNTNPPMVPIFPTSGEQNRFDTMLDHFGMTLGVYQFACYSDVTRSDGAYDRKCHACYPHIEIESDKKGNLFLGTC